MAGDNGRQSDFFPAHFGGPADFPAMPHIGTLARLIIKYPACLLLGKSIPDRITALAGLAPVGVWPSVCHGQLPRLRVLDLARIWNA